MPTRVKSDIRYPLTAAATLGSYPSYTGWLGSRIAAHAERQLPKGEVNQGNFPSCEDVQSLQGRLASGTAPA